MNDEPTRYRYGKSTYHTAFLSSVYGSMDVVDQGSHQLHHLSCAHIISTYLPIHNTHKTYYTHTPHTLPYPIAATPQVLDPPYLINPTRGTTKRKQHPLTNARPATWFPGKPATSPSLLSHVSPALDPLQKRRTSGKSVHHLSPETPSRNTEIGYI